MCRTVLTVDICDFIEDANEAFLFDVTLDHEMFADQVQLRRCLSYKANKEIDMMIIALASIFETSKKKPEAIHENDTTYRLKWRTNSGRSWGSEAVWARQQLHGRCTGPAAAPAGSPRPTRPSERGAHGATAAITVDLLLRLRPYLSAIYLIKFFDSYEIV